MRRHELVGAGESRRGAPVMRRCGIRVGLLVAAVGGTAACGASGHTAQTVANGGSAAAPTLKLRGTIVFRRFLDDAHSHGALFVMDANTTRIRPLTHPPANAVDSLNGPPG